MMYKGYLSRDHFSQQTSPRLIKKKWEKMGQEIFRINCLKICSNRNDG